MRSLLILRVLTLINTYILCVELGVREACTLLSKDQVPLERKSPVSNNGDGFWDPQSRAVPVEKHHPRGLDDCHPL